MELLTNVVTAVDLELLTSAATAHRGTAFCGTALRGTALCGNRRAAPGAAHPGRTGAAAGRRAPRAEGEIESVGLLDMLRLTDADAGARAIAAKGFTLHMCTDGPQLMTSIAVASGCLWPAELVCLISCA